MTIDEILERDRGPGGLPNDDRTGMPPEEFLRADGPEDDEGRAYP